MLQLLQYRTLGNMSLFIYAAYKSLADTAYRPYTKATFIRIFKVNFYMPFGSFDNGISSFKSVLIMIKESLNVDSRVRTGV